jgi:anti-anti-sigma factor
MKIAASTMDGVLIVTVGESQLVSGNVETLKAEIDGHLTAGGHRLILDLGPVSFLDSSGVGMLVALMKSIARAGGAFRIAGLGAQPLALVRTVSLDRVIPLSRNVEEALAALTGARETGGAQRGEPAERAPGDSAGIEQMLASVLLSHEALFGPTPERLSSQLRALFEREMLGPGAPLEPADASLDAQLQAQRRQVLGEMAAGMAARFKKVLNLVIGRIQFLHLVTTDETICGSLEIMEKSATQGLAAVLKVEEFCEGASARKAEIVSLRRLIDDALDMIRMSHEDHFTRPGKNLRVIREFVGNPSVVGSQAELKHAIVGILLNAVEAMPEGGVLTVSVNQSGPSATVLIADTGRGMTAEAAGNAFDPRFSTKGENRTGLGLAIARSVFERHQGSIVLESQQGKGTAVTIHLPAVKVELPAGQPAPAKGLDDGTAAASPVRVLVVDDEPTVCDLMKDILSAMGYKVVTCENGREALHHVREGRFDLVMTDLAMPGMNGWEVAREIRALDPFVPVALFSAWGSQMDASLMRERGVDFLFPKPFEIAMIRKVMTSAITLGNERRTAGSVGAQSG